MRELAQRVLIGAEEPAVSEGQLATDVMTLLEELGSATKSAETRRLQVEDTRDRALDALFTLVTAIPVILLGEHVSWWLAFAIWESAAAVSLLLNFPRWDGMKSKAIGTLLSLIVGPISLARDFTLKNLLPRFASQPNR